MTWRGTLLAVALIGFLAASFAVLAGPGLSPAAQAAFSACPPKFVAESQEASFQPGEVTQSGKTTEVKLLDWFNPQECRPEITLTAAGGASSNIAIPQAEGATAKAVREVVPNACPLTRVLKLPDPTGPSGQAIRTPTCDNAVLALALSPKTGHTTRTLDNGCQVLALATRLSSKTASAHKEVVSTSVTVLKRLGQENLLESDQLVVKVTGPKPPVGTPFVGEPENPAQLKECKEQ